MTQWEKGVLPFRVHIEACHLVFHFVLLFHPPFGLFFLFAAVVASLYLLLSLSLFSSFILFSCDGTELCMFSCPSKSAFLLFPVFNTPSDPLVSLHFFFCLIQFFTFQNLSKIVNGSHHFSTFLFTLLLLHYLLFRASPIVIQKSKFGAVLPQTTPTVD